MIFWWYLQMHLFFIIEVFSSDIHALVSLQAYPLLPWIPWVTGENINLHLWQYLTLLFYYLIVTIRCSFWMIGKAFPGDYWNHGLDYSYQEEEKSLPIHHPLLWLLDYEFVQDSVLFWLFKGIYRPNFFHLTIMGN